MFQIEALYKKNAKIYIISYTVNDPIARTSLNEKKLKSQEQKKVSSNKYVTNSWNLDNYYYNSIWTESNPFLVTYVGSKKY